MYRSYNPGHPCARVPGQPYCQDVVFISAASLLAVGSSPEVKSDAVDDHQLDLLVLHHQAVQHVDDCQLLHVVMHTKVGDVAEDGLHIEALQLGARPSIEC
jgi:hypothetical protein